MEHPGAPDEEPFEVGADGLAVVELLQVRGDTANHGVGGHPLRGAVARQEIVQRPEGQRVYGQLRGEAAVERRVVAHLLHHHPDLGAGQHDGDVAVLEQMIPRRLQVRG